MFQLLSQGGFSLLIQFASKLMRMTDVLFGSHDHRDSCCVRGPSLPLRKANGQFKKNRIDRGYQIVRDSSPVEGELELEAYGLLDSPCQPPNSSEAAISKNSKTRWHRSVFGAARKRSCPVNFTPNWIPSLTVLRHGSVRQRVQTGSGETMTHRHSNSTPSMAFSR